MAIKPLNASGCVGEAMAVKDAQGYDRFLSQAISENNTYRLFFYMVEMPEDSPYAINGRNVLGAAYGGRNCDPKAVKCSFLPLTDFDRDEFGQLKDNSDMGRYARIASIIHEGKFRYAVYQAEQEAKKLAEDNGEPVDAAQLAAKKKTLDEEYHGATVNDVNVPPKYMPVIRGTSVFIFVSAVLVLIDPDGTPSKQRTGIERVSLNISKKKAQELNRVLSRLTPEQLKRGYIEVHYAYNGKDKNEAGRNSAFEYVDESSQLSTKFPDWWKAKGPVIENMMIKDVDAIGSKNRNVANPPDMYEVVMNFKKYLATNRVYANYMDFESSIVKNAAEDLLNIDSIRSLQKVRVKLEELVAEANEAKADKQQGETLEETGSLSSEQLEAMQAMEQSKTLGEIISNAGGMEAMDGIVGDMEIGQL